ncbi:MAG TPA: HD domain-containing protein [Candidatus Nanoarchaeia archaeon]|nr:HD domain-containing protein [Candidatus Nanoarchaeia archaeon]
MKEINQLRTFYKLKKIYRANTVTGRKESSAEHSWSCLILADYFLSKMNKLDRLKVYELLMYHDVVEIEAGDVCISDEKGRKGKEERELQAMHILTKQIPKVLKDKFVALFTEFEAGKTREAKFAKAIDALDAQIHEMDHKGDWKGWPADLLQKKKGHLFEEFPEMNKSFQKLMKYLQKEGYFDQ